jgi:hypothetical protein
MKRVMMVILLVGLFASMVFSQSSSTLLFLRINPSARQAALGDAGVSMDDDVYSIFFNPAGLARQYDPKDENSYKRAATFSYAQWLPNFNLNDLYYLFWAGRMYVDDIGMFGLSFQYMNYGDIQQTGENGEDLGTFSSNELAVTLAYALPISENLDIGLGIKYIYSNLAPVEGVGAQKEKGITSAMGVDLGVLYRMAVMGYNTKLGAAISNMGPKVTYVDRDQADPMPIVLRAGFSIDVIQNEFNKLMFIYQFERELTRRDSTTADGFPRSLFTTWKNNDNFSLFTHSFGLEYWYADQVALRAGYFYETPKNGDRQFMSLGMGLKYLMAEIDVAYLYALKQQSPLAETLRLTVSINF